MELIDDYITTKYNALLPILKEQKKQQSAIGAAGGETTTSFDTTAANALIETTKTTEYTDD